MCVYFDDLLQSERHRNEALDTLHKRRTPIDQNTKNASQKAEEKMIEALEMRDEIQQAECFADQLHKKFGDNTDNQQRSDFLDIDSEINNRVASPARESSQSERQRNNESLQRMRMKERKEIPSTDEN